MSASIRVKFSRRGPVCYTGHLDVLRYFQKIIARAGINIKYSQGFNPHQLISFAYPLGVSMETVGDYMDMEVESFESLEDIVNRFNSVLNEGIKVESVSLVPEGALNAMASVAGADYLVFCDTNLLSDDDINKYMSSKEILITKEGKKGTNEVDIKPGIYSVEKREDGLYMMLASGSALNIKPSSVIDTINVICNKDIKINKIRRLDIYRYLDDKLVPLGEF